ncbi:hypothetical protein SNEBB_006648 [Seison nebaliae]|nr:hypothetical protein SNEBB_006648 [Seison nebaliae]
MKQFRISFIVFLFSIYISQIVTVPTTINYLAKIGGIFELEINDNRIFNLDINGKTIGSNYGSQFLYPTDLFPNIKSRGDLLLIRLVDQTSFGIYDKEEVKSDIYEVHNVIGINKFDFNISSTHFTLTQNDNTQYHLTAFCKISFFGNISAMDFQAILVNQANEPMNTTMEVIESTASNIIWKSEVPVEPKLNMERLKCQLEVPVNIKTIDLPLPVISEMSYPAIVVEYPPLIIGDVNEKLNFFGNQTRLTMKCESDANPKPNITPNGIQWFNYTEGMNGGRLTNCANQITCQIQSDVKTSTRPNDFHELTFRCVVSNRFGKAEKEFNVNRFFQFVEPTTTIDPVVLFQLKSQSLKTRRLFQKNRLLPLWIVLAILAIIIIGGLVAFFILQRRKKTNDDESNGKMDDDKSGGPYTPNNRIILESDNPTMSTLHRTATIYRNKAAAFKSSRQGSDDKAPLSEMALNAQINNNNNNNNNGDGMKFMDNEKHGGMLSHSILVSDDPFISTNSSHYPNHLSQMSNGNIQSNGQKNGNTLSYVRLNSSPNSSKKCMSVSPTALNSQIVRNSDDSRTFTNHAFSSSSPPEHEEENAYPSHNNKVRKKLEFLQSNSRRHTSETSVNDEPIDYKPHVDYPDIVKRTPEMLKSRIFSSDDRFDSDRRGEHDVNSYLSNPKETTHLSNGSPEEQLLFSNPPLSGEYGNHPQQLQHRPRNVKDVTFIQPSHQSPQRSKPTFPLPSIDVEKEQNALNLMSPTHDGLVAHMNNLTPPINENNQSFRRFLPSDSSPKFQSNSHMGKATPFLQAAQQQLTREPLSHSIVQTPEYFDENRVVNI